MRSLNSFRVTAEPLEEARLLRASGELDRGTAPALRRELAAARAEGITVVLDLAEVTFIDSTGLELLLEESGHAATTDWAFFVVRPSKVVVRLIDLTRTADLLMLVESPNWTLPAAWPTVTGRGPGNDATDPYFDNFPYAPA